MKRGTPEPITVAKERRDPYDVLRECTAAVQAASSRVEQLGAAFRTARAEYDEARASLENKREALAKAYNDVAERTAGDT